MARAAVELGRAAVVTAGRVTASTTLDAPPEAVWEAVTARGGVARWWGLIGEDITHVAQEVCVRTGSSSFYRAWVEVLERPREIEFVCAYLGVAPPSRVRWVVDPLGDGRTRVSLTEDLDRDDPATVHLAEELWRGRLARLRTAALGGPAPVAVPDIELDRVLDRPGWRPLHRANVADWLPLSGTGFPPRWFHVVDADGARPFPVTSWRTRYDDRLELCIALAPRGAPSRAEIAVGAATGPGEAVRLRVRHTGWADVDLDGEARWMLNLRFRATWRHALAVAGRGG